MPEAVTAERYNAMAQEHVDALGEGVSMTVPVTNEAQLAALQQWKDTAADPALRNMDQFALQVGMALQKLTKQVEKLIAKLDALAAVQGLAWQSGWLPAESGSSGQPKHPSMSGFDIRSHTDKVPEGAVPMLKGGWVYPTYL